MSNPNPNNGTATIGSSGGTFLIPNESGASFVAFEELFTGTAPATCSITIQGVMRAGTLDTAASTSTTVTANIVVETFTKPYSAFLVTATWTGGDTTTAFEINWQMGLK